MTAPATRTPLPFTCSCGGRWGGQDTTHCKGCHATFAGPAAFDAHRVGGGCLTPAGVGLVPLARPYTCYGFGVTP